MALLLDPDLMYLYVLCASAGALTILMLAVLVRLIYDRRHLATQPVNEEPMHGKAIQ